MSEDARNERRRGQEEEEKERVREREEKKKKKQRNVLRSLEASVPLIIQALIPGTPAKWNR